MGKEYLTLLLFPQCRWTQHMGQDGAQTHRASLLDTFHISTSTPCVVPDSHLCGTQSSPVQPCLGTTTHIVAHCKIDASALPPSHLPSSTPASMLVLNNSWSIQHHLCSPQWRHPICLSISLPTGHLAAFLSPSYGRESCATVC